MTYNLVEIERKLAHLPQGLLAHCKRTSQACLDLAERFGCHPQKAEMAGLVHDVARAIKEAELLSLAESYGVPIGPVKEKAPFLLHGPVGAEILKRDFCIQEEDILQAVRCHTTGKPGMSILDKVLFLADKIEPGKAKTYPGMERVRQLAGIDLDQALLEFFNQEISHLIERGKLLHPVMVEARNDLLMGMSR